jgi:ferredoxin
MDNAPAATVSAAADPVVQEMTMRVEFDESKCIASGQCVMVAPDVFDQREDDGIVIVLNATPGPGHRDEVRDAVAKCPAVAIRLVE